MYDLDNVNALSLYHFVGCPYCAAVSLFIDQSELNIEHRDISMNPLYQKELLKEGGKLQVPCLKIENQRGQVNWLYESQDILDYLGQINQQVIVAD